MASQDYRWFEEWLDHHLGVTLLAVSGIGAEDLLKRLNNGDLPVAIRSLAEAEHAANEAQAVVRCVQLKDWALGIEAITATISDQALVEALSADGEAVALSYTQSINWLWYARNGQTIAGLDLDVESSRTGSNPTEFDDLLHVLGLDDEGPGRGLALLETRLGLHLTPGVLGDPHPSVVVPVE